MLKIDVITLFPNLIEEHLKTLPFKKAIEKGLIKVTLHNLRDYAVDKHGTVDDKPYGGGTGMVLMVEPIYKALQEIDGEGKRVIVLSPKGTRYTQEMAKNLAKESQITLICGRYEGIDARVGEHLATDVISLGDFVVSGGETPAIAVMESVVRLLPGVLEKEDAAVNESFTDDYIEHPQYTRPENFRGMTVPKVLLSGNHQEIEEWKRKNSKNTIPQ
jgi:tRNA (guanine37-N1)-methyltransferase